MTQYKVKRFELEYKDWGEFKDKYVATIKFEGGGSNAFTLQLSDTVTSAILSLLLSTMVEESQSLVESVIAQVQEQILPPVIEGEQNVLETSV